VSSDLGPVRQLGYVVRDLDRAMRQWTEVLGVGPFFYIDELPLRRFMFAGEPSEPHLSAALSYSGDVQIELITQRNDAPSMWRAFLDDGHEGPHHVAFWTHQFDRDLATLTARGLQVGHSGESGGGPDGRFAYLQRDADPQVIELSELNDTKAGVFRIVAEAARSWDGSDPVRELNGQELARIAMGPDQ
jgi:hypothetical protein